MKIGICFGGYCPMHQGHLDVIMQAKKENDVCFVVVCGYNNEPRSWEINLNIDFFASLFYSLSKKNKYVGIKIGWTNFFENI